MVGGCIGRDDQRRHRLQPNKFTSNPRSVTGIGLDSAKNIFPVQLGVISGQSRDRLPLLVNFRPDKAIRCRSAIRRINQVHMKNDPLRISATIALAVLSITPASAEPFANDAIERYRLGDPAMFAFLAGNVNGLTWANTNLRSNDHTELFCVPPSVTLSVQQAVEIMSKHIRENPTEGQLAVGSLMIQSLKETFPCK